MHDSFEKEVQKKMEELRLAPSAPVWEKIEIEIQPEKRRRRVFLWLFFGLLLAGGGFVTYQLADNKQAISEKAVSPVPDRSITSDTKKETLARNPGTTDAKKATKKRDGSTDKKIDGERAKEISQPQEREALLNHETVASEKPVKKSASIAGLRADRTRLAKQLPPATSISTGTKEETTPGREQKASTPGAQTDIPKPADLSELSAKQKQTDSLTKQPRTNTETPTAADSSLKRKVAKKGWQKQILVSGGVSGYRTLTSPTAAMVAGSVFSSPGTVAPVYYRPAETTGGVAFGLGFSLAKKLNDHFELALGLQYAHYSTKTKVGNGRQNDTTLLYASNAYRVNSFYTNTSSGNHVNRFHVVEVPVTFSYKPLLNLPVYVSVSAAYGRMVATNALTFSNRNNVYFQNKEDYVKNTLPVSSSVQVELFGKKKVSMRVGPVVQYNLLKLQKEATEGERHLFFAGIRSAISF